MAIHQHQIFIPIPRDRFTNPVVKVAGVAVTNSVLDSSWFKETNDRMGNFTLKLLNASEEFSDKYVAGDIVQFFADYADGSTQQFYGRIDQPREILSRNEGQILEITGRHRSYRAMEVYVNYSAENQTATNVLKAILKEFLPEFTLNNIEEVGTMITVNWDYTPFLDCVAEICNKADAVLWFDDDLDTHFHEKGEKPNLNEYVAQGDNFIETTTWGKDDFIKVTRVTVIGDDGNGIPILDTQISDDEGTEIREYIINDKSRQTYDEVKDLATSTLSELSQRPDQGVIRSFGLSTLNQGQKIWLAIPRQKIYGQYNVKRIEHNFGQKTGWKQNTTFENDEIDQNTVIHERIKRETQLRKGDNPNNLRYSYNLNFKDSSLIASTDQVNITDETLRLDASLTTGIMVTLPRTVDTDINKLELRFKGRDLGASVFRASANNGDSYSTLVKDTLLTLNNDDKGQNLIIEVTLNVNDTNPDPQLDGVAVLFDTD